MITSLSVIAAEILALLFVGWLLVHEHAERMSCIKAGREWTQSQTCKEKKK